MKKTMILFWFFIIFFLTWCDTPLEREGEYFSDEDKSSDLTITKDENGEMKAELGIFRLTTFSDMVVTESWNDLILAETGEFARPISFLATQNDEMITIKVIHSDWELLEEGETFTFPKEQK